MKCGAENDVQQKVKRHGCSVWAEMVRTTTRKEQRRGSYGTADALRQFKQSIASVINRKGSHVNEEHQLEPLE